MNIILALVVSLILINIARAGLSFAPWLPSRKRDLKRIFKLADLKPGEKFYDLGCGDGQLVFYAADHFNAQAVGLEISVPMFLISRARQIFHKKNATIKFKNLFKQNLSDADVVYLFGLPNTVKNKIKQKLEKELKPGSRVISYAFHIPDWTPALTDKPKKNDISIYLYRR